MHTMSDFEQNAIYTYEITTAIAGLAGPLTAIAAEITETRQAIAETRQAIADLHRDLDAALADADSPIPYSLCGLNQAAEERRNDLAEILHAIESRGAAPDPAPAPAGQSPAGQRDASAPASDGGHCPTLQEIRDAMRRMCESRARQSDAGLLYAWACGGPTAEDGPC
jgi:hypothetical protein